MSAVFGPEPRGVTRRRTFDVLKACDIMRDRDALQSRTMRELSRIKD